MQEKKAAIEISKGSVIEFAGIGSVVTGTMPSEARVKCVCGENIVKKGVVRNKILILDEDGGALAVCPRCCREVRVFSRVEVVKGP